MKPTIRIHNLETGEIIDREMTDDEHTKHLRQKVKDDAYKASKDAEDAQFLADKASGEAKLLAVGLTKAEIKAVTKDK